MKRLLLWQVSVRCRRYKIDQGWKCTTPWNGGLNNQKSFCTITTPLHLLYQAELTLQGASNYWIGSKSQRCLDFRNKFKYSWNYHFGMKKQNKTKTQECKEAVGCFVPKLYGGWKRDVSFRVLIFLYWLVVLLAVRRKFFPICGQIWIPEPIPICKERML